METIKAFCCYCREEVIIKIKFGRETENKTILGLENWTHYISCPRYGFNALVESKIKEAKNNQN